MSSFASPAYVFPLARTSSVRSSPVDGVGISLALKTVSIRSCRSTSSQTDSVVQAPEGSLQRKRRRRLASICNNKQDAFSNHCLVRKDIFEAAAAVPSGSCSSFLELGCGLGRGEAFPQAQPLSAREDEVFPLTAGVPHALTTDMEDMRRRSREVDSEVANPLVQVKTPEQGRGQIVHESVGCKNQESMGEETDISDWLEHDVPTAPRESDASVPVFIMLPLDSVTMANTLSRPRALRASLSALRSAGLEGVMMDVWWGIVEKNGPRQYDWSAYRQLVDMVKEAGLKIQAVMSFHQCGGNVGDHCLIPLPPWVQEEINANPDIVYTDKSRRRNREYISLGCDDLPVLRGRTPIQSYADFMRSFRDEFIDEIGSVITEIQVGMGPAGELRYPSYPESNGRWRFPGIGEFQCYDKYMLARLGAAAEAAGRTEWGYGGPHDAGQYQQWPHETGFFHHHHGSWNSPYGRFFLQWYSSMLIQHGDRVLAAAAGVFRAGRMSGRMHISGKVAGVHWHYGTASHAPELTAGYYNTIHRDGYLGLARMFARHGATLNFTCIEMRDSEQWLYANCSPEGLLRQVAHAAKVAGVRVSGENALPRFDDQAFEQIVRKSRLQLEGGVSLEEPMVSFTFLRMSERAFRPDNWHRFVLFVRHMRQGRPWGGGHESLSVNVAEIQHHLHHLHVVAAANCGRDGEGELALH